MERHIYRCDMCKEEFDNEEKFGYDVYIAEIGSSLAEIQGHTCQECFKILFKDWQGERLDVDGVVDETDEE